jgi:fructose-1,6-bisphosphatase I
MLGTLELATDTDIAAAGGKAVNSRMERMLEVVPEHIHDRSGIFLGSEGEVQKVIDAHKKYQK